MVMFRYFKRMSPQDNPGFPSVVPTLSSKDVQCVNDSVKLSMEREASEIKRVKYNDYTATESTDWQICS